MITLPVTVPLRENQTALSFASSLAAANGARAMRDFLRHMGIAANNIAMGETTAIERLAQLGNVDPLALRRGSIQREKKLYALNGELLLLKQKRNSLRLAVCPHCIREDIASGTGVVESRPYFRIAWLSNLINNCPIHRDAMKDIGGDKLRYIRDDLPAMLRDGAETIVSHFNPVNPVSCDFDRYVLNRLHNSQIETNDFLDPLPLYAAAQLTEWIGAQLVHSPGHAPVNLHDRVHLLEVRAEGFKVTADGVRGFQRHLDQLTSRYGDMRPQTTFKEVYGILIQKLIPDIFIDVQHTMRQHAVLTLPRHAGIEMFGPLSRQRLCSLYETAKEFRIDRNLLRDVATKRHWIKHTLVDDDDFKQFIEVEPLITELRELAKSLPFVAARTYVGASVPLWRALSKCGYVSPSYTIVSAGVPLFYFRVDDLDRLKRQLENTITERDAVRGLYGICKAVRLAKVRLELTLDLLLSNKLQRVGLLPDRTGFGKLSLSPAELRRHQRGCRSSD